MDRKKIVLFIGLALLMAGCVQQTTTTTTTTTNTAAKKKIIGLLQIKDIQGEATIQQHDTSIDLINYSITPSQQTTTKLGKPTKQSMKVTTKTQNNKLLHQLHQNQNTIGELRVNTEKKQFILENVIVQDIQSDGNLEEVTLEYEEISWNYTSQDSQDSAGINQQTDYQNPDK